MDIDDVTQELLLLLLLLGLLLLRLVLPGRSRQL
jgi:hypothetical protein